MYRVNFGDETGKIRSAVDFTEYNAARLVFDAYAEDMPSDTTLSLTDENGEVLDWSPSGVWASILGKGKPIVDDESVIVGKPTDTPNHYMEQGVETIDIIEEAIGEQGAIDFIKGNIIKYLCRMDKKHKTPIDDAKKIKHYAEMLVDRLEANE